MTSAVLVSATCYAIFFAPNWIFVCVLEVFILLGISEYFDMAEKKGYVLNRYLGLLFASLLPVFNCTLSETVIFTVAALCIFLFNFHRRLKDQALVSTALTLFGLLYVGWFCSFLAKIKWLDHGSQWVFYVVSIVKMGDAGAYFIGKRFGTHKYVPHISPNKSVEGALGGFLVTVLVSLGSKMYLPSVPMFDFLILGMIVGVLAQLGDLAESLVKREVGFKDSGNWPGLGGALDVLDSLIFALPCVYYYVQVFQNGAM